MNLKKLFELQKNLDNHIITDYEVKSNSLLSKKVLALQVQLAVIANETKCFEFWDSTNSYNKEDILKEFVACLHFILTLGLEKNFTDIIINVRDVPYDITSQFLSLYIDINDFFICSSQDHYITLFEDFFALGKSLGFTSEDIENEYYNRNCVKN